MEQHTIQGGEREGREIVNTLRLCNHNLVHQHSYFCFISAPKASPTIPFAQGISRTSVQFNFSSPRPYYAAYDITGYTVRYWKVGGIIARSFINDLSVANVTFPPGSSPAILKGLEVYTKYCLSARLVSSFGSGEFGPCTTVMTLEGGKQPILQMCDQ